MVQHTFYLIRHGNSEGNSQRKILSSEEDILTELGKKQAASLGDSLADVKFTKVFSSDYSRTFETSEIVLSKSNYSKNVPIQKEPRLREKNFGAYEGQMYGGPLKELAALLAEGKSALEWYPANAETWEEMYDRAESFLNELYSSLDKSQTSETVMLTSHGFFIQTFMMTLKKSEKLVKINWDDSALKLSRNCSYIMFTLDGEPGGFSAKQRPLQMLKIHEWGHLDASDSLIDFANSPNGKLFQNCIQT